MSVGHKAIECIAGSFRVLGRGTAVQEQFAVQSVKEPEKPEFRALEM
jgi:hypothetical protein